MLRGLNDGNLYRTLINHQHHSDSKDLFCDKKEDILKQAGVVKDRYSLSTYYFSVSENHCLHMWISSFQICNFTEDNMCQLNPRNKKGKLFCHSSNVVIILIF